MQSFIFELGSLQFCLRAHRGDSIRVRTRRLSIPFPITYHIANFSELSQGEITPTVPAIVRESYRREEACCGHGTK